MAQGDQDPESKVSENRYAQVPSQILAKLPDVIQTHLLEAIGALLSTLVTAMQQSSIEKRVLVVAIAMAVLVAYKSLLKYWPHRTACRALVVILCVAAPLAAWRLGRGREAPQYVSVPVCGSFSRMNDMIHTSGGASIGAVEGRGGWTEGYLEETDAGAGQSVILGAGAGRHFDEILAEFSFREFGEPSRQPLVITLRDRNSDREVDILISTPRENSPLVHALSCDSNGNCAEVPLGLVSAPPGFGNFDRQMRPSSFLVSLATDRLGIQIEIRLIPEIIKLGVMGIDSHAGAPVRYRLEPTGFGSLKIDSVLWQKLPAPPADLHREFELPVESSGSGVLTGAKTQFQIRRFDAGCSKCDGQQNCKLEVPTAVSVSGSITAPEPEVLNAVGFVFAEIQRSEGPLRTYSIDRIKPSGEFQLPIPLGTIVWIYANVRLEDGTFFTGACAIDTRSQNKEAADFLRWGVKPSRGLDSAALSPPSDCAQKHIRLKHTPKYDLHPKQLILLRAR